MIGQTIRLHGAPQRLTAHRLIDIAPPGSILNVREAKRSDEQNAKLWAMLSDVSRAKPGGRVLAPDLWKCVFMSAVGHQCRFEPSLDGKGVVPVGFKSSRLAVGEMSELIEQIYAFGAEHDVVWTEPMMKEAA